MKLEKLTLRADPLRGIGFMLILLQAANLLYYLVVGNWLSAERQVHFMIWGPVFSLIFLWKGWDLELTDGNLTGPGKPFAVPDGLSMRPTAVAISLDDLDSEKLPHLSWGWHLGLRGVYFQSKDGKRIAMPTWTYSGRQAQHFLDAVRAQLAQRAIAHTSSLSEAVSINDSAMKLDKIKLKGDPILGFGKWVFALQVFNVGYYLAAGSWLSAGTQACTILLSAICAVFALREDLELSGTSISGPAIRLGAHAKTSIALQDLDVEKFPVLGWSWRLLGATCFVSKDGKRIALRSFFHNARQAQDFLDAVSAQLAQRASASTSSLSERAPIREA